MKKILVLSLVLMLVLAACGKSGDGVVSESTAAPEQSATDTSAPADTAPTAKTPTDLHSVVNATSAFGNFRDMMFVYSDDEYADDLLIFTFGMTEEMIGMFDSYVASELTSNTSTTFAYFVFKDGTDDAQKESVKNAINETYIPSVKAAVEMYNPEAYALCDEAVLKTYDDALLLLICESDVRSAVISAVESAR